MLNKILQNLFRAGNGNDGDVTAKVDRIDSTLFSDNAEGECCLCGATEGLTGEHKVKASTIRSIFEPGLLYIGENPANPERRRPAQGPGSKAFHFRSKICVDCNSSRTQAPDIEFTRFDQAVQSLLAQGLDPSEIFARPRYSEESDELKNVFRYLAKILACHIADVDGPRFLGITEFAIGRSDINPVRLRIDRDAAFDVWFKETGVHEFAHHGGLGFEASKSTRIIQSFYTTLTHGPLRYTFGIEPFAVVTHTIEALYPKFYERILAAHDEQVRLAGTEPSIDYDGEK